MKPEAASVLCEPHHRRFPTALQQLADAQRTLAAGKFRHQRGWICFRFAGNREAVEIQVITSRDTARRGKKSWQAAAIEALEETGEHRVVKRKPPGR